MAKRPLPGDLPQDLYLKEVLRVDHAGEYGAVHIYKGQLRALKNHKVAPLIQEMLAQEEEHLAYFNTVLAENSAQPSKLLPLWKNLSLALGYITGMLGKRTAMAATVAVEEVIDAHYTDQINRLSSAQQSLKDNIAKFQKDEIHHKELGLDHEAKLAPFYPLVRQIVRQGSKLAIAVAKRV